MLWCCEYVFQQAETQRSMAVCVIWQFVARLRGIVVEEIRYAL